MRIYGLVRNHLDVLCIVCHKIKLCMNRFRLGGQLGNGSYSEVFKAENLETGE
jgi:hypothetical protein